MEFLELIKQRQSCRDFDSNRPVDEMLLRKCIAEAEMAPSACNAQPYYTHIITGAILPEAIKCLQNDNMNAHAKNAQAMIVIMRNPQKLISTVTNKEIKGDYTDIDIGIFTAHLVLSLKNAGLDSCIIGYIDKEKLSQLIKTDKEIALCILVGYQNKNYSLREKKRKNRLI